MFKRGDIVWGVCFALLLSIFLIPTTREPILALTARMPYTVGFIEFAILASMGDILGARIVSGDYHLDSSILWNAIVWGIIGWAVTLVYPVYLGGTKLAQEQGYLPFAGIKLAQAFFGSTVMDLTFTPALNIFHRISAIWIETFKEETDEKVTLTSLVERTDWVTLIITTTLKVTIFMWIPVHTITFMFPPIAQVAISAFTSILLGVVLSATGRQSEDKSTESSEKTK